jgi:hypothetical protein
VTYTAAAERWDHDAVAGDTYQPAEVELRDLDGLPVSIAGATGEVALRRELGAAAALTPTWTIVDAAGGVFTWSAPAASTANLVGEYQYAVRVTWPDGLRRTILRGTVTFLPSGI